MVLLENLEKVHTTEMGVDRIKRNIGVDVEDIVEYCVDKIKQDNAVIERKGKNYYVTVFYYFFKNSSFIIFLLVFLLFFLKIVFFILF